MKIKKLHKFFNEDEINLSELFAFFLSSRKFILISTFIFALSLIFFINNSEKSFESSTVIEIATYKPDQFRLFSIESPELTRQRLNNEFIELPSYDESKQALYSVKIVTSMTKNGKNHIRLVARSNKKIDAKRKIDNAIEFIEKKHNEEFNSVLNNANKAYLDEITETNLEIKDLKKAISKSNEAEVLIEDTIKNLLIIQKDIDERLLSTNQNESSLTGIWEAKAQLPLSITEQELLLADLKENKKTLNSNLVEEIALLNMLESKKIDLNYSETKSIIETKIKSLNISFLASLFLSIILGFIVSIFILFLSIYFRIEKE